MKKILMVAMAVFACVASAGVLDRVTMSRYQAKLNERQLVGRETVVIGGVTNIVTMYRQSGVEWAVTNAPKVFRGTLAVKKYSRLKVYVVCVQMGLWEKLEAWLKTQNVNGVNAYTAFMLANELTADNELFIPMMQAAKTALGVDDATIKAVLAASEM